MRRRDLLGGLSLVPLAAPAVAQCVVATFPRINLADRCEGGGDPASLNLTFMVPGQLDPRITFARASVGTYFDSAGIMQTAATNAPRWDYDPATLQLRGLLIEEARTNLLLNSATLSTQSVTVTAAAHTLSFYGGGTITKSGTATGALVGTGVGQRVVQTFTPTAGSLTLTVTGSVLNAQLETGTWPVPSSYITTGGTSATRAADVCNMTGTNFSTWFNNTIGSFAVDVSFPAVTPTYAGRLVELTDGTAANFLSLLPAFSTNQYQLASTIASASGTGVLVNMTTTAGQIVKACWAYGGGNRLLCVNASPVASTAGGIATVSSLQIGNRPAGDRGGVIHVRILKFWARTLSLAEMQAVTS